MVVDQPDSDESSDDGTEITATSNAALSLVQHALHLADVGRQRLTLHLLRDMIENCDADNENEEDDDNDDDDDIDNDEKMTRLTMMLNWDNPQLIFYWL